MAESRRRAVGAELVGSGVNFRVWAPARSRVTVVLGSDRRVELGSEGNGYFSATVDAVRAGMRYRFQLDDEKDLYPDPASRFQPDGPHGPSEIADPQSFRWHDQEWRGVGTKGLVIYELHVGTFTPEGTFAAAIEQLPPLAATGINMIEVMPVNEFPGRFGWGYDGVDLWAPSHLYGRPDDLRRLVDAAHRQGIAVILDVVYNHLGPDGCYLNRFTPDYFTAKYANEWGDAINFDGPDSRGVREFFVENAACWIDEFHLDGLRLDATQSIHDDSEPHILKEIADTAHAAGGGRPIFVVAENEPQEVKLIDRYGIDALWNDDWHHSATVAATGRAEAYYTDYRGRAQEFVSMARTGFLYQGQWYGWQKQRRGTPSAHVPAERLVCALQNHDQIANSSRGERIQLITSPGKVRALTALLLLQPQTPMLFQGQEFASSKPFLYFADHHPELAKSVRQGRHDFLKQFPRIATPAVSAQLAPPESPETFARCKLDFAERDANRAVLDMHRDLIQLRRTDPLISQQRTDVLHGAVLAETAFVLRWMTGTGDDRLLIVNLGPDLHLEPMAEPLLAPPSGCEWELLWSSESCDYGGEGTPPPSGKGSAVILAEATVLLRASRETTGQRTR